MKRLVKCSTHSNNVSLVPITKIDPGWIYIPKSSDVTLFENPITYAGNQKAKEVLDAAYDFNYEIVSESEEDVNIHDLMSIQAFVTEKGIFDYTPQDDDEIWAVRYENQLYLMNGNHRVVIALLKGQTHVTMTVEEIQKK